MDELPRTRPGPLSGFLTVEKTGNEDGFIAAWMVADSRGYPLEFLATTPVRPSLVQKTLYGSGLERYVGVELCGRKLVHESQRKPSLVLVPEPWLLDIADSVDVDMLAIWRAGESLRVVEEQDETEGTIQVGDSQLVYKARLSDPEKEGEALAQLQECIASFDPIEAFGRMRAALELLAKEDPRYA